MRQFVAGVLSGALILAVLFLLVVWFSPWHVEATQAPGVTEVAVMKTLLSRALRREAPEVANPFPPSPENHLAGMKIFRDACAGCHGDGSKPSLWGSTSFSPRVPQFATAPPRRPEAQVHWIVKNGIRYTAMGAWQQLMTEDQIWKVTGFVTHIDSLPADIAAAWRKKP
jgi:mono/diheme cytochrome c family protein